MCLLCWRTVSLRCTKSGKIWIFSGIYVLKWVKINICTLSIFIIAINTKFPGDDTKKAYILIIKLLFFFIIKGNSSL